MKIRRFFGKDMREALRLVREELGGEAVIMATNKVNNGIELVAAYDKEPVSASAQGTGEQLTTPKSASNQKPTPTLSEIIGDDGPDSLKALLDQQDKMKAQEKAQQRQNAEARSQSVARDDGAAFRSPQDTTSASERHKPDIAQQVRANNTSGNEHYVQSESSAVPGASANPYFNDVKPTSGTQSIPSTQTNVLDELKDELASLRNVLQFQVSGLLEQDKRRRHPLHGYLSSRLQHMGITRQLAEQVVAFAPENCDERQAWLFILKLLANRLSTNTQDILGSSGVVALLGATGAGKTTTAAKLAARYAQKYGADQVALVTIDGYRIAAFEQLATYARIIGCSVKKAQQPNELSDVLYNLRHKRMVIIDSAGFSQRDERLVRQLDNIDQLAGNTIRKYVLLPATAQYKVMQQTLHAYQNVQLSGSILTKLDECYSLGEALSVVINSGLSVSYVTNGQKVPEDIKRADAKFLVSTAAKLYKKYGLAHTTAQQAS